MWAKCQPTYILGKWLSSGRFFCHYIRSKILRDGVMLNWHDRTEFFTDVRHFLNVFLWRLSRFGFKYMQKPEWMFSWKGLVFLHCFSYLQIMFTRVIIFWSVPGVFCFCPPPQDLSVHSALPGSLWFPLILPWYTNQLANRRTLLCLVPCMYPSRVMVAVMQLKT